MHSEIRGPEGVGYRCTFVGLSTRCKQYWRDKRDRGDESHRRKYPRSQTPAHPAKQNPVTTAQKGGKRGLINFVLSGSVLSIQDQESESQISICASTVRKKT